jgi:adenosylhomocysteinase
MDMSFAIQALCAEYVKVNGGDLAHTVHVLPAEVDQEVARIKLDAMGVAIDTLTDQQYEYLNQWEEGT